MDNFTDLSLNGYLRFGVGFDSMITKFVIQKLNWQVFGSFRLLLRPLLSGAVLVKERGAWQRRNQRLEAHKVARSLVFSPLAGVYAPTRQLALSFDDGGSCHEARNRGCCAGLLSSIDLHLQLCCRIGLVCTS